MSAERGWESKVEADLSVDPAAPYVLPSSGLGQPLPFDATGDMRTDLLGFSVDSKSAPVLWNNVWEESGNTAVFNLCVLLLALPFSSPLTSFAALNLRSRTSPTSTASSPRPIRTPLSTSTETASPTSSSLARTAGLQPTSRTRSGSTTRRRDSSSRVKEICPRAQRALGSQTWVRSLASYLLQGN